MDHSGRIADEHLMSSEVKPGHDSFHNGRTTFEDKLHSLEERLEDLEGEIFAMRIDFEIMHDKIKNFLE